jgi:large subunit ribosomal protein L27
MVLFKLDLQFFAQKKGGGSTKNGRDSAGKRLGIKKHDGEKVKIGMIIFRQRGQSILVKKDDKSVGRGKDYTLFSLKEGKVKYYLGRNKRTFVKVS